MASRIRIRFKEAILVFKDHLARVERGGGEEGIADRTAGLGAITSSRRRATVRRLPTPSPFQ